MPRNALAPPRDAARMSRDAASGEGVGSLGFL
jgi:hypothetical protein